ncbi:phage antirepressor KilAC domain-containing protein [uncultured Prevotella sp.]|uniref:phage antirepressor KilAC domain-containing protein n=1 Tax=uncultured Prevotella sp. TaxID=159272 RepID=UPI00259AC55E|nr:phage antirepressor KilAC domain-containing protein [uncultured Prevotella sp.]
MNTPIVYDYKGSKISFANGKNVMVNATEMAKTFGKYPKDFLVNKQTKEFLSSLSAVRGISLTELVKVVQGGDPQMQGTWMHEDVALEFARWLSPAFAIWCNDRIKELLKYGMTATQSTLDEMVNNPDLVIRMATQLKQEREEKARLEAENKRIIEETAPAVTFTQAVSGSASSCLIGELAKLIDQNGYPMGEKRLFKWLRENGYLGTKGERYNIPNQRYIEQGLFELKKGTRSGNNGVMYTTITPKVTGKGQIYFVNKFKVA